MNDAPPPLTPQSSPQPAPDPYRAPQYQPQPQAPKSSTGKWLFGCGCGCLGLLLLLVIGVYFAVSKLKTAATELVANYTAAAPVKVEIPPISPAQVDQAVEKFSAFQASLSGGGEAEPLVLSGQDINALIQNHVSFKPLTDRASVTVEGSTLRSQVSVNLEDLDIPVPFLADAVAGKYFNGVATFTPGMVAGRPALYIEDLKVNGMAIPEQVMSEFRKTNLLEEALKNSEFATAIEKIEDIRVKDGVLTIVPKSQP
ncbi:MAG: hypothetical protein GXX91_08315 [Verrucomicrobiaceae bacterium]|nr:hypothetical protein [Verrucomicrobiaceae bacterium]